MKRYIHTETRTTLTKLKNKRVQVRSNEEGTAFRVVLADFNTEPCMHTVFERGIRYGTLYLTKETIEEIYNGMVALEQLKEEQR
jgi:hypothetical protein